MFPVLMHSFKKVFIKGKHWRGTSVTVNQPEFLARSSWLKSWYVNHTHLDHGTQSFVLWNQSLELIG